MVYNFVHLIVKVKTGNTFFSKAALLLQYCAILKQIVLHADPVSGPCLSTGLYSSGFLIMGFVILKCYGTTDGQCVLTKENTVVSVVICRTRIVI